MFANQALPGFYLALTVRPLHLAVAATHQQNPEGFELKRVPDYCAAEILSLSWAAAVEVEAGTRRSAPPEMCSPAWPEAEAAAAWSRTSVVHFQQLARHRRPHL